jgi:hypothetical protein
MCESVDHGTWCMGHILTCDDGWSSNADMLLGLHECTSELSVVRGMWIIPLLLGVLCMILGSIKLYLACLQVAPDADLPLLPSSPMAPSVAAPLPRGHDKGKNAPIVVAISQGYSPKTANGIGNPNGTNVSAAVTPKNAPPLLAAKTTNDTPGSPSVGPRSSRSGKKDTKDRDGYTYINNGIGNGADTPSPNDFVVPGAVTPQHAAIYAVGNDKHQREMINRKSSPATMVGPTVALAPLTTTGTAGGSLLSEGPSSPVAAAAATVNGNGVMLVPFSSNLSELSHNDKAIDIKDKDVSVSDEGGGRTGPLGGHLLGVGVKTPNRRNYRQWLSNASQALSFRMATHLFLLGVFKTSMASIRIYNPSHAIGHHLPITIIYGVCSYSLANNHVC